MTDFDEQPFRELARELILRLDRTQRDISRQIAEMARLNDYYFKLLDARAEDSRQRLEEIQREGRAGREALFRILDRLDGGGGAAPAA